MKLLNVNINLQQGVFVDEKLNQVFATYSRHHNVIFVLAPWKATDLSFPEGFEQFKVITGFTDSVGLTMYRPSTGSTSFNDAINQYNLSIENKRELA